MRRATRFSNLPPDLNTELRRVVEQASSQGRDVIDLATDSLEFPQRLAASYSHAGMPFLRIAATQAYRDSVGVEVDPERELLPIGGAHEAMGQLFLACLNPGDSLLLPSPGHPSSISLCVIAGGTPAHYAVVDGPNPFERLSEIDGKVVANSRAIVVSNPLTPYGTVISGAGFAPLIDFARETGLLILCDSSYAAFAYDGEPLPSILETAGASDLAVELRSVVVDSESSPAIVTVAAGNADAISALWAVQSHFGGNSSLTAPHGDPASQSMNDFMDDLTRRRNTLVDGLNSLGWTLKRPEAGVSVWASVPPDYPSQTYAQALLEEASVLVAPGDAFGPAGEGYIRFSWAGAASAGRVVEAIERMRQRKFGA